MKKISALSLALLLAGCQENLVRSDFISPNAGDAVAVNASNQTIDPWPSYVYNTRIETSAERQSVAIKKYNAGPTGPAAAGVSPSSASPVAQ